MRRRHTTRPGSRSPPRPSWGAALDTDSATAGLSGRECCAWAPGASLRPSARATATQTAASQPSGSAPKACLARRPWQCRRRSARRSRPRFAANPYSACSSTSSQRRPYVWRRTCAPEDSPAWSAARLCCYYLTRSDGPGRTAALAYCSGLMGWGHALPPGEAWAAAAPGFRPTRDSGCC